MIEAVSAWVKGIVYIVLFAAFLELLLPNGGMQKFVRVIMGLLIMMAVLNPVIDLLDKKPDGVQPKAFDGGRGNDYQAAGIANAASGAREKREQLAKEYYAKDLARQIRATVLSVGGVSGAEVRINLKENVNQGYENPNSRTPVPQVARVVILVEQENRIASPAVKAVKIAVGSTAGDKTSGEESAEQAAKTVLSPLVKEKIERAVSELYHISLETIEVQSFSAGKELSNRQRTG